MDDTARRWVGIDVARGTLDVPVRPSDDQWTVANDEAGVRTLVEKVRRLGPTQVVIESTGG